MMNADEFAKSIALKIKQQTADELRERDARIQALHELIIQLRAEVSAIPPARDGRDGLPGAQGPQGERGKDGRDGIDGKDGAPGMTYKGVYDEAQQYERGDCVTWGGSLYHCDESTTEKPGNGKGWTLAVKKGRDAKETVRT